MNCIGATLKGFQCSKRLPKQIILQRCGTVNTHIKRRLPRVSLATATNSQNLPRKISITDAFPGRNDTDLGLEGGEGGCCTWEAT